jgi:hypothetical protein
MMHALLVDRFALYFFYLFLAAHRSRHPHVGALPETEHENHGEYYALMLLSVAA